MSWQWIAWGIGATLLLGATPSPPPSGPLAPTADAVSGSPDRPDRETLGASGERGGEDPAARPFATADLAPKGRDRAAGEVSFTLVPSGGSGPDAVMVTVKVRGVTPGDHAIGLAAGKDCAAPDARFGTIGPLRVGANGEGRLTERLAPQGRALGPSDVLGHAFVVSADRAPVLCGRVLPAAAVAH